MLLPKPHYLIDPVLVKGWERVCRRINPKNPIETAIYLNNLMEDQEERLKRLGIDPHNITEEDQELIEAQFRVDVMALRLSNKKAKLIN